MKLKELFNRFENLFLQNHACICCRREIVDGTKFSLCEKCLNNLNKISGNVCKICGEKILGDNKFCDRCKENKYNFDKSNSFCVYDEVSGSIVKRFKYSSKKYYGKYIAQLMAEKDDIFEGVDFMCFVPIGKNRKRERGFNQAEQIAKELSKIKNIEVIDLLEKVGNEKHQAGLSQKNRYENLKNSFKINEQFSKLVKNKVILVIDDVFTTGTTLSECAKVIKIAKPKKVLCYTFAKTVLNLTNNG